jgi:hypothetical protein
MENNYKKYNELLLTKFPSLKDEFEKYTSSQDGINTGSTLVYEDIFVPFVIKQLININIEEINKITELIDELLASKDEYANNIAYVAILESLKSDSNGKKIRNYLNKNSLKYYDELTY